MTDWVQVTFSRLILAGLAPTPATQLYTLEAVAANVTYCLAAFTYVRRQRSVSLNNITLLVSPEELHVLTEVRGGGAAGRKY
jgi:hypothetical protein